MRKIDLINLGFRDFYNPKRKDSFKRLHWSFFREAGQVLNIVIVYKENRWQFEYLYQEGHKIASYLEDFSKKPEIAEIGFLVKKMNEIP